MFSVLTALRVADSCRQVSGAGSDGALPAAAVSAGHRGRTAYVPLAEPPIDDGRNCRLPGRRGTAAALLQIRRRLFPPGERDGVGSKSPDLTVLQAWKGPRDAHCTDGTDMDDRPSRHHEMKC